MIRSCSEPVPTATVTRLARLSFLTKFSVDAAGRASPAGYTAAKPDPLGVTMVRLTTTALAVALKALPVSTTRDSPLWNEPPDVRVSSTRVGVSGMNRPAGTAAASVVGSALALTGAPTAVPIRTAATARVAVIVLRGVGGRKEGRVMGETPGSGVTGIVRPPYTHAGGGSVKAR